VLISAEVQTGITTRPIRVLVAKAGLDGHDRGAQIIARALRDAGMEVLYTGLRKTPESIVLAAIQEDVDCIGLSILSGAHNALVPRIVALLKEQRAEDILLVLGGTIPQADVPGLKEIGVAEVFGPGTPLDAIVDFLRARMKPKTAELPGGR
jgi:methylmalonyl-CoA mutase C-terminal domain/subunit